MENSPKPTNFATICYHYRDAVFAQKIATRIRHFKLPVKLQKSGKLTATELSALNEMEIGIARHEGSTESPDCRFLIAVSSVHAVDETGNSYLNDIIESFIADNNGKVDGVIPIINRTKNGARATRCLPAAAATRSLLAADVADKGDERIISDVVSHMLALNPDDLWDRQLRYRKQKNRIVAGIGLFVCMLLGVIGYHVYDYYTPDYYYYESFVEQNNMPVGLNQLDASVCSQRAQYFEFEIYHGMIRSVTRRNGRGYAPAMGLGGIRYRYDSNWPHVSKYVYDDKGTPLRCEHFLINGRKIATRTFMGDITELKSHSGQNFNEEDPTIAYNLLNNYVSRSGDELFMLNSCIPVSAVKVVRDDRGRVISSFYLNAFNKPIKGANGEWGRRFTYSVEGHLTGYNSLDSDGNIFTNLLGFSGERYSYDESGKLISTSYVDMTGAPCVNSEGIHSLKYEYNEEGNICRVMRFNLDGQPALSSQGLHRTDYTYNEYGDLTVTEGRNCEDEVVEIINTTHDERGRVVKYFHSTADGTLTTPVICLKYDDKDNEVETRFLTQDGKPVLCNGYHLKARESNANGQVTAEFIYGLKDEPIQVRGINHCVRYYYDERGYLLAHESYDPRMNMLGRTVYERQITNGARLSESIYDAQGNPHRNVRFPKRVFKRNELGLVTEITNYVFVVPNHVQPYGDIIRYTYTDKGMVDTEMIFSGNDSEGVPVYSGRSEKRLYAGKKYEYDAQDRKIRTSGLTPAYEPEFLDKGIMAQEYEYDLYNRIVCIRNTDDKGNLTLSNGVAITRTLYDAKQNSERECYFNLNDEPCYNRNGVHCVETKYTRHKQIAELSFFDTEGRLLCGPNGYAYARNVFDKTGNIVRTELYDANMQRLR